MARDTNRHVKQTLPPTLAGFAGQAQIRYYVKVTVQRPAFYKENFRSVGAPFIVLLATQNDTRPSFLLTMSGGTAYLWPRLDRLDARA